MPYCTNCGQPVKENQKFCGSCGNPLVSTTNVSAAQASSSDTQTVVPAQQNEIIRIIIPNLIMPKSWGRSDTFNLIVTDRRSIFALLTNQIMSETIKMRRDRAAAEGKGFFGKWAAQMKGLNTYVDRYSTMSPYNALAENKVNFQIENSQIKKVKSNQGSDEDNTTYDIEIITTTQKLRFKTQYDPGPQLKEAYG